MILFGYDVFVIVFLLLVIRFLPNGIGSLWMKGRAK